MEKTTVLLPPELKARATRWAKEKGVSLGEVIREALAALVARPPARQEPGQRPRSEDPFFKDHEVWDGEGPTDISVNHDKYLYG
ncbi:MAG: CopG family transcriptional regulator, partial [Planctomycetaceae bacterium]